MDLEGLKIAEGLGGFRELRDKKRFRGVRGVSEGLPSNPLSRDLRD